MAISDVNDQNFNSYASVAEADEYFNTQIVDTTWSSISNNTTKSKLLVWASNILDTYSWAGRRYNTNQVKQWPRYDVKNKFTGEYLDTVDRYEIPNFLRMATIELARNLFNADTTVDSDTDEIDSVKLGNLEVEFNSSKKTFVNDYIRHIISPYTMKKFRLVRS